MISFIAHLPSAMFTRGGGPPIPFGALEELGKVRAIDPNTGQPFKGPSLAWELIKVPVQEITNQENEIKRIEAEIQPLSEARQGHLAAIKTLKVDLAMLRSEWEAIKAKGTEALAAYRAKRREIAEVEREKAEKEQNARLGSGSTIRHLDTLLIDLKMERDSEKAKIEQYARELWAKNYEIWQVKGRIDSKLTDVANLNEELKPLYRELHSAQIKLDGMVEDLKIQTEHIPHGDPIFDAILNPIFERHLDRN